MDSQRLKDKREVAKFALLCGISQAAQMLKLDQEVLAGWVKQLDIEEIPLCAEARKLVKETVRTKGITATSKKLGIEETTIREFIGSGETDEQTQNCTEKSTQTPDFLPAKRPRTDCDCQTIKLIFDPTTLTDQPADGKLYSTAQKIRAVRKLKDFPTLDEAAFAMQTSADSLFKWRNKVKSELFQVIHVEKLYSSEQTDGKKKSFFGEMDEALFQWWKANAQTDVDAALLAKAKLIAKVDDVEPVVTQAWLKGFRSHYQI